MQENSYWPIKMFKERDYSIGGFLLIELMLVLMLSSLGFIFIFESLLSTYNALQKQSLKNSLLLQAQAIDRTISQDLHQSGYLGCAKLVNNSLYQERLLGNESSLQITYAGNQASAVQSIDSSDSTIKAIETFPVTSGDHLLISDCYNAEVVIVKAVHHERGMLMIEPMESLHHSYESTAELRKFIKSYYYVLAAGKTKANQILYKQINSGENEALAKDILQFSFRYILADQSHMQIVNEINEQNVSLVKGVEINFELSEQGQIIKWETDASV